LGEPFLAIIPGVCIMLVVTSFMLLGNSLRDIWDVNNGIARRNWARNPGAITQIKRAMKKNEMLSVTLPNLVDDNLLNDL
jgi:hypothetical protein